MVFVVATANDISQLPPELLRKGRFDEIFFVDLPSQKEREQIWQIQIAKYGRKPEDFDTVQLARICDGLTGSEIEAVFTESLYTSFGANREPSDLDIAGIMTEFTSLAETMSESIKALRTWAKGRARLATQTRSPNPKGASWRHKERRKSGLTEPVSLAPQDSKEPVSR